MHTLLMPTVISEGFEWDSVKAAANYKKHGVTFEEAKTAFSDPHAVMNPDVEIVGGEERVDIIGFSARARILMVVHIERGVRIRIISARVARRREEKLYEEQET
jgi:uncharacterized protein